LACALVLPTLIRTAPDNIGVVRTAFLVVLLAVALDRIISLPENVLRGENLAYKAMGLGALSVALGGLLSIMAILGGYGLVGLAVATLASGVPSGLSRLWVARTSVSWFGLALPSRTEFLEFARVSGWLFFSALSALLVFSSDLLLVGLLLTPSAAAVYATTGAVLRIATEPIGQFLSSGNAGIAGLCGRREWTRVIAARLEMHMLALVMATVVGGGVLALNRPFIRLWVGEGFFAGDVVNLLLVTVAIARILLRVDAVIVDCLLDFRAKTWALCAAGLMGITIAALLSPFFGMAGIAAGTLVGHAALLVCLSLLVRRRLGLAPGAHFCALYRPAAVAVAVLVMAGALPRWGAPEGWQGLIVWGAFVALGGTGVMWRAALPGMIREKAIARTRSVLRPSSSRLP
jgi:O-antigen/teichoic acid export membrane protein